MGTLAVLCLVLAGGTVVLCAPSTNPLLCSPCPPGYGVSRTCTEREDTSCTPCLPGTYSKDSGDATPCTSCSKCGEGLFELHPCTATEDVFCELCSWTVPDNADYQEKCAHASPKQPPSIANRLRHKGKHKPKPSKTHPYPNWMDQPMGDQPSDPEANQPGDLVEEANQMPGFLDDPDYTDKVLPRDRQYDYGDYEDHKDPAYEGDGEVGAVSSDNITRSPTVEPPVLSMTGLPSSNDTIGEGSTSNDTTSVEEEVETGDDLNTDYEGEELIPHPWNTTRENGSFTYGPLGGDGDAGSGEGDMSGDYGPVIDTSTVLPVKETSQGEEGETGDSSSEEEDKDGEEDRGKERGDRFPIYQDSNISINGSDEQAGTDVEATSAETPIFGVVIAALTAGIVFFAIGFFFNRAGQKYGIFKSSDQEYERAPSEPRDSHVANNVHEMQDMRRPLPTNNVSSRPQDFVATNETGRDGEADGFIPSTAEDTTDSDRGHQSPVNIVPDDADLDDMLEKNPLRIRYLAEKTRTLTNTGTTLKVDVDGEGSGLQGGPLGDRTYMLDHFHFHWGASIERGSEHTLNGRSYAGELHLVHWNTEDYSSFAEAVKSEDGLAVLAVFLKASDCEDHLALQCLTDCLPSIQYKGESRDIPDGSFDPASLLPANTTDYWTYSGSLTTPPYLESVTWLVFKQPIRVSLEQMSLFRQLLTFERDEGHDMKSREHCGNLVNNFRQTQPLNGRHIRASFL